MVSGFLFSVVLVFAYDMTVQAYLSFGDYGKIILYGKRKDSNG